jgi:secondary thiamine-phosphate synthase enzyme
MRQATGEIEIASPGAGLHEVTEQVRRWIDAQRMSEGLLTVFCRHTSASLLIQENAAPAARRDLEAYFARIAPEDPRYEHDDEGPDDMPAHLRAALTQVQLSIPLIGGRLALGTWQSLVFVDTNRDNPRREVRFSFVAG